MQQKVWSPSGSGGLPWGINAGGNWGDKVDTSTDVPTERNKEQGEGNGSYTTQYTIGILCTRHYHPTLFCKTYAMSNSDEHYVTCPNANCQDGGNIGTV